MTVVEAHPWLAVAAAVAVIVVLAVALTLRLTADPPGGRNASRPVRRGPAGRASEQRARAGKTKLAPEDQVTLDVISEMRAEDTGGLIAINHEDPAVTARERYHEDMGYGAGFFPAPPPLPNRGDAQGRDVRVCAAEPRPAARADLTGSLSPCPTEERPGPVSAPPDPGTTPPLPASVTAQLAPLAALVEELRQADNTDSFAAIAAGWA